MLAMDRVACVSITGVTTLSVTASTHCVGYFDVTLFKNLPLHSHRRENLPALRIHIGSWYGRSLFIRELTKGGRCRWADDRYIAYIYPQTK